MADDGIVKSDLLALELRLLERIEQSELRLLRTIHDSIEQSELRMLERIEKSETNLLKEFRKWAVRIESRLKADAVFLDAHTERLAMIEERLDALEAKQ